MLSRHLLHTRSSFHPSSSSSSAVLLYRTFTSTSSILHTPPRSPSISDITPEVVKKFDQRQKDFRARTVAAQQAREQQESQSSTIGHVLDARHVTSASSASASSASTTASLGLGSLITTRHAGDDAVGKGASSQQTSGTKGGALSSLIYGTPEGRQLDKDLERSFSQVLARGRRRRGGMRNEYEGDVLRAS